MSSETPAGVRHRIDYVDGLRAVAVLSVVLCHVEAHGALPQAVRHALDEGAHGVDLFFIVSGFCLAFPTLAQLRRRGAVSFDVAGFGAKRLVRIVPPFYLATLALLATFAAAHLTRHHTLPPDLPGVRDVVASLFFIDGKVRLVNSSFWTLMVEFRWYFAFPLLLALWIRSPRAFLAVGVASIVLYHLTRARGLDFGTLPAFMLGIVAADLQLGERRSERWARALRRYALPLAAAGVLAGLAAERYATIPGTRYDDYQWPFQPTILGWQLAAFFFVVAAGHHAALRNLLSVRPLIAVGIASYSIYLVHEPIISALNAALPRAAGFAIAPALAVGAGFAFWAVAERPFTDGALRRLLVAHMTPVVTRALGVAGVGTAIALDDRAFAVPSAPLAQAALTLADGRGLPRETSDRAASRR